MSNNLNYIKVKRSFKILNEMKLLFNILIKKNKIDLINYNRNL